MIKTLLLSLLLFNVLVASNYTDATKMYKTGKYQEGLDLVKSGLKTNPKDWQLFLVGGKIRSAMKDNSKAVANFELAHKYNPSDKESLELLVKYSKIINDKSRIEKYQKKLDDLNSAKTTTVLAEATSKPNSEKVVKESKKDGPLNFSSKEKTFEALENAITNAEFDYAYKIVKSNLKKYNNDPTLFYYAGIVRYERGEYKDAIINFNTALKDQMNNYRSFYYLGMIFEKQEDWAKSSANYKNFVKYPVTPNLKAELEVKIKEFTDRKVEKIKTEKKENEPKNVKIPLDSNFSVEITDTTSNDAKKAVTISKQLIKDNKFDRLTGELITISSVTTDKKLQEDIEWSVVNIYMYLNLFDKSSNALKSILIRYPNSSRINIYKQFRANASARSLNPADAIPLFQEIIGRNKLGYVIPAYNGIINIYLESKDYARALKTNMQKLSYIEKNQRYNIPEKIETLYNIADINFKLNKMSETKDYLQKILAIEGGDNKYYKKSIILLGDIAYKNGDSRQALKYYLMYQNNHSVLDKYDPNNSWVLFQIANCYRNQNNFDSALDYYDNLIQNYPETDIWVKSAKWKKNDTIWQSRYQQKYNKILK